MRLRAECHCFLNWKIPDSFFPPQLLPTCYPSIHPLWALYHLVLPASSPLSHLPLLPTSQTPHFPLSLPSSPLPSCLPSQPCTPELHPGPEVVQEDSLGTEAQMERVTKGNSSDLEQPYEDKNEGPAQEVGPRARGMPLPTHRVPSVPGSLPGCHILVIRRLSDPVQEGKLFCQILCVRKWGACALPAGEQGEWTLAGRKEAPTETWPVQELSFPFWEEGKILRAAYLGSEAILGSLPVTSSSGSNPGAKAEPWTPSARVPWPDPAAQASHGPPLTTKPGKGQF